MASQKNSTNSLKRNLMLGLRNQIFVRTAASRARSHFWRLIRFGNSTSNHGFRRDPYVWSVLKRLSPKKMAAFLRENAERLPGGRAVIRCRTAATKSFGK